jgi:hypothetical protein
MFSTRSAQQTAEDAVQIFGGRGITKTGMGRFVEHYHRTVPFDALLGGGMWSPLGCAHTGMLISYSAEDVLGDLGVRQAMRAMPKVGFFPFIVPAT